MKCLLLIVFPFFLSNSYGQTERYSINYRLLDSSNYTIINGKDPLEHYKLNSEELLEVEHQILSAVGLYNSQNRGYEIQIQKYKFQLVIKINESGQKEVWVNSFFYSPYKFETWRKQMVAVRDGGNRYFKMEINIDLKKLLWFRVNGEA